jgi:hypothetical protein
VIVRKPWLAGILLVGIFATRSALAQKLSPIELVISALSYGLVAFLMLRFGILATAAGVLVQSFLTAPFTTQGSAWYAWIGWLNMAALAVLVLYGLRIALAGQSLFSARLTADD